MKKTVIVEVSKILKKFVAVELDDDFNDGLDDDAENYVWELAHNGDLDFDWPSSEEYNTKVLGRSVLDIDRFWKNEDLYEMEEFCYKESDNLDKRLLKEGK